MTDISDDDIFHVFDCCQWDPYVSQNNTSGAASRRGARSWSDRKTSRHSALATIGCSPTASKQEQNRPGDGSQVPSRAQTARQVRSDEAGLRSSQDVKFAGVDEQETRSVTGTAATQLRKELRAKPPA